MKAAFAIAALFACNAFAAEPAYWMKSYPNAPQAKVDRCLVKAETVYQQKLSGGMEGVMWAVLWKGNAWEACMNSK